MIRTALYVRVSGPGQDLVTQAEELRRYAMTQGWAPIEVFEEVVSAAGSKVRPELERLRASIRLGVVDIVLVTKLDRLSRSVQDALSFFAEAEARGVRVVVTTQQIDTATPVGRLSRTILAAVAEFEGELIRERTRSAMAAIKEGRKVTRSGRPPGRPLKLTSEAVEHARALRTQGLTWPQAAQQLGLKAESIRRAVYAARTRPVAVENTPAGTTPDSPGGDLDRA